MKRNRIKQLKGNNWKDKWKKRVKIHCTNLSIEVRISHEEIITHMEEKVILEK